LKIFIYLIEYLNIKIKIKIEINIVIIIKNPLYLLNYMDSIAPDLLNYVICPLLNNQELINLVKSNQYMTAIKCSLKESITFSQIEDCFCKLVTKIIINTGDDYNTFMKHLDKYYKVRTLTFGDGFNQPVIIPASVTTLIFGFCFNQPITIPASVTTLIFGVYFNQPIIIPTSVTTLTFGIFFDKPITIPTSVTTLTFGCNFGQPITVSEKVKLTYLNEFDRQRDIPNNVTYIDNSY
jgi:hypothetical protein